MTMKSMVRGTMLATTAMLLSACAADREVTAPDAASAHLAHNAQGDAEFGVTDGWQGGRTVEFFYHKNFFCKEPPTAGSDSKCEAGAEGTIAPRPGKIPVLYVMTPLGFRPDDATLQCPVVGSCINHPSTIDLSRIFGSAAANAPLPAHSHIVDAQRGGETNGAQSGWWELEVVGVTDPAVWNDIAQAKSLARVRELQAAAVGITGDIPTNAYLFFGVRPKRGE